MKPAGKRSLTCTPVALLGPLLVAVTVNITLLPNAGVGLLTDLAMAMSADTGVTVALAELLPATGSVWSSAVLVAVLVAGAVVLTVARIERVTLEPFASAPMFQTPVPEL